jgi:hypothetical protein
VSGKDDWNLVPRLPASVAPSSAQLFGKSFYQQWMIVPGLHEIESKLSLVAGEIGAVETDAGA